MFITPDYVFFYRHPKQCPKCGTGYLLFDGVWTLKDKAIFCMLEHVCTDCGYSIRLSYMCNKIPQKDQERFLSKVRERIGDTSCESMMRYLRYRALERKKMEREMGRKKKEEEKEKNTDASQEDGGRKEVV